MPQEWNPDPEVSLKDDDLYARALVCEYEKPPFDAKNDNATPSNSPEIAVQPKSPTEETWNTPEAAQDCPREDFPETGAFCDVTDTNPYKEPVAETSSEQPNTLPSNACTSKYNLYHKLMSKLQWRLQILILVLY